MITVVQCMALLAGSALAVGIRVSDITVSGFLLLFQGNGAFCFTPPDGFSFKKNLNVGAHIASLTTRFTALNREWRVLFLVAVHSCLQQ